MDKINKSSVIKRLFGMMAIMDKVTPVEREQMWPEFIAIAKEARKEHEQLTQELSELREKKLAIEELSQQLGN